MASENRGATPGILSAMRAEIQIDTAVGKFAGVDFGGQGSDVLLVHGTGHNSAGWAPLAKFLRRHCHAVAVDLRGHGHTPLDSADAEQYWCDLGPICEALDFRRPVLVGHSTGGYAVVAAAAAGLIDPAGVCVLDGFVPDTRAVVRKANADTDWQSMSEQLRAMFRYGWIADAAELAEYVERIASEADSDWLNAGVPPAALRALARRSFVEVEGGWLRRPTLAEIDTVRQPVADAPIFPSVEVYQRVVQPLALVLASEGLYAGQRELIRAVARDRPNRAFVEIPGGHYVHLLRPRKVAEVVLHLIRPATVPGPTAAGC